MMKALVLKDFSDKYTGKKYKKDDVIEVSEKRFNEITEKGKYVKVYEPETAPSKKENK